MLQIHVNYAIQSNYWREFFSAMAESWKNVKTSTVFLSFIVCLDRYRSDHVYDIIE